jgi:hypothetical protein
VGRNRILPIVVLILAAAQAPGQTRAEPEALIMPRTAVAGGMGVAYVRIRDVVDLINAAAVPGSRVSDFRAAGEFFGTVDVPLNEHWVLAFDYGYITTSLAVPSGYGQADFGVTLHLPSVLLQYILAEKGMYNIKAGAGPTYLAGSMHEKYLVIDDTYSATGFGVLGRLEANTALGDRLFASLGANLRWAGSGGLRNAAGVSPGVGRTGSEATLGFIGVGARIGLSYQF